MTPGITVKPDKHAGTSYVTGTHISVQEVLELIREGTAFETIITGYYPDLTVADIRACIEHGAVEYPKGTSTGTSVQTRAALIAIIRKHRANIRALGANRIGLFGSFARDRPTAASDVDILVEFGPDRATLANLIHLALLLEDSCRRHVELVSMGGLSPYIGPRILETVEYVPLDD